MTIEMSDELKLQIIKSELDDVMMCVKMLITTKGPIEAQRQYITGELPEVFHEVVESDDFKSMFNDCCKAYSETISNIIVFIDNIARLFDIEFESSIPKSAEELKKMTEELYNKVNKK